MSKKERVQGISSNAKNGKSKGGIEGSRRGTVDLTFHQITIKTDPQIHSGVLKPGDAGRSERWRSDNSEGTGRQL